MGRGAGIELDAEAASTLRRMAGSGIFQTRVRAQIVLALAGGERGADVARRLFVAQTTVRRWRERFRAEGIAGLADRPGRGRKKGPRPTGRLGEAEWAAPDCKGNQRTGVRRPPAPAGRRGRPAAVSGRIEAFVRERIAGGAIRPNAVLPPRSWFMERFQCTSASVQRAFSRLAGDGFVIARPGSATRAAPVPPFAGRFLLVTLPDNAEGITDALKKAAAGFAARHPGASFEVRDIPQPGNPAHLAGKAAGVREAWAALCAEIAAHRWAGVFYRHLNEERFTEFPPPTAFAGSPQSGLIRRCGDAGGNAVASMQCDEMSKAKAMKTLFSECAASGRRRVAALTPIDNFEPGQGQWREDKFRKELARHGLEAPPCCVQGAIAWQDGCIETAARTLARVGALEGVRAYVCEIDGFVRPMARALVERLGAEGAARCAIYAVGNRPSLPDVPGVPVVWHGFDLERTLDSFAAWCDALRVGEKPPPPPVLATF